MKELIATILLLFSSEVIVQAKKVWACQGTHSSGFSWETEEGYSWESAMFNTNNIFVTLDGSNSSFKKGELDRDFECAQENVFEPNHVYCVDTRGSDLFRLNKETGQAALSSLYGATTASIDYRDSVAVNLYQCTKI